jgi:hypothetical protein
VEIQSFILCREVIPSGVGQMLDGRWLGVRHFFPIDTGYPLRFAMSFFTLLRREHRAYDEQCSLRFDLVDEDGKAVGQPNGVKATGVFPIGARFFHLNGLLTFELPAPGDYRLDITADEEGRPFVYAYNIEATERQE